MMGRRGGGKRGQGRKFQNAPTKKAQDANVRQNALSCPGCNFSCFSIQTLRTHFQKTGHDQAGDGKSQPDAEVDDTASIIPDHIKHSVTALKDYTQRPDREPIIGLEYVLEYRLQAAPDRTTTRYYCQVCAADYDLVPMMEHLSSYRHRKLYLMKEFPYVLRAPSNAKENRAQFMRRMAMEIEREEGRKLYQIHPDVRMAPMKSADGKQSKIKTRWNYEGDRVRRMRKALEYLETFEIDNDTEASTVTRLTEKLIAELKYHSDKLREEALFPAKVARAKDIAMSIMQNVPKRQMAPKNQSNPVQKGPATFSNQSNPVQKGPATFSNQSNPVQKGPATFSNQSNPVQKGPATFSNQSNPVQKGPAMFSNQSNPVQKGPATFSNQSNPVQKGPATFSNQSNPVQRGPATFSNQSNPVQKGPATFNKGPPENINVGRPSGPPQPKRDKPSWTPNAVVPHRGYNVENIPREPIQNEPIAKPNPAPQTEQPNEDNKFVKKLQLLLSVLQQNSASASGQQMNSKLVMLKSLFLNKPGNTPANQLQMHMGPMMQNMAGAENAALYQQLQLMASTNPAAMAQFGPNIMMQMATMANNAIPMENAQVNPMMQMAVQLQNNPMSANSFLPENRQFVPQYGNMNPMMPMDPNTYQNPYVEQQQGFPNTFQSNEGYGYDGRMTGNNTMRPYGDYPAEEAPYTRVSLSPSNQRSEPERFPDDFDLRREVQSHETRPSYGERRPRDEPAWAETESDMHYGKRARQDSDHMSSHSAERGRHYPNEGDAVGTNTPNLSVDLLKRIRGKDLFTVSAILSEYADNQSSR